MNDTNTVPSTLAEAIIALHDDVRTLPKDGWNNHSNYSYAKGDTVVREARKLLLRAIAINEKAFDPDHPPLAATYSNLAAVEQALGNAAGARRLLRRAIAIDERVFDPDHPDLATRYSNLAAVEPGLGDMAAARPSMLPQMAS